ncbi:MAG: hypothetical protein N2111_14285 [Candidatus Sumerlaeaceae bacterium]|nr:hypothetical protein [Candidatus Sumerlaeaceae bacterium]
MSAGAGAGAVGGEHDKAPCERVLGYKPDVCPYGETAEDGVCPLSPTGTPCVLFSGSDAGYGILKLYAEVRRMKQELESAKRSVESINHNGKWDERRQSFLLQAGSLVVALVGLIAGLFVFTQKWENRITTVEVKVGNIERTVDKIDVSLSRLTRALESGVPRGE